MTTMSTNFAASPLEDHGVRNSSMLQVNSFFLFQRQIWESSPLRSRTPRYHATHRLNRPFVTVRWINEANVTI